MTREEMVERVAREMCRQNYHDWDAHAPKYLDRSARILEALGIGEPVAFTVAGDASAVRPLGEDDFWEQTKLWDPEQPYCVSRSRWRAENWSKGKVVVPLYALTPTP